MSDFVFFLKLSGLTLALVLVMQIQVGETSIEDHAMSWVQSSTITSPLNAIAHGGAKMFRDGTSMVHSAIVRKPQKYKKEEAKASSFRWDWIHRRKPAAAEESDQN